MSDLVLLDIGLTANQALEEGIEPFTVWSALVLETGSDEQALWVHRRL